MSETLDDAALLDQLGSVRRRLLDAIGQRIVGQEEVVELMLIALFARGHCLFVGVGLAKTLLVSGGVPRARFGRVQFTPDLMPADITGTEVLEEPVDGRALHAFFAVPSSPTCCWRTRSTGRRPDPGRTT